MIFCHTDIFKISKIMDRVVFLQQDYSDETVSRCRQHSSAVDRMQIPARFEDTASAPVRSTRPSSDFDVRTVDQGIIQMTSRLIVIPCYLLRN